MLLGSYRPLYDVDFSAKEKVTLLSGYPDGGTQLLISEPCLLLTLKWSEINVLNLKIKITFLSKYPVCAINRAIFSRLNGLPSGYLSGVHYPRGNMRFFWDTAEPKCCSAL